MAEFGAHLTSSSVATPSIFEVLAQESLQDTIRPSLQYLTRIIGRINPVCWGTLEKYFDELYLLLDAAIQHNFLKVYGSSFAENFYGLKRISQNASSAPSSTKFKNSLPKNDHIRSLVCLVIFPYVKLKLDHEFEKLQELQADGHRCKKKWHKCLHTAFLYAYPWFHLFWRGSVVFYLLSYVFGKSRFHSPLVQLSGTQLVTITHKDLNGSPTWKFPFVKAMSFQGCLRASVAALRQGLLLAFTTGLSIAAFFIQFLDWWNAVNRTPLLSPAQTALPPPKVTVNIPAAHVDAFLCPLCLKQRKNDTALATSGYVFCYTCIHRHLNQCGKCPITNYASTTEHLIRLYPPGT